MLTNYGDESPLCCKKCNGEKQKRGMSSDDQRKLGTIKIIRSRYGIKVSMFFPIVARTSACNIFVQSGEIFDCISSSSLRLQHPPALRGAIKSCVERFGVQYATARMYAKYIII